MRKLTDRQKEILDFVGKFTRENTMAPTVYEIAEHFNISSPTAFVHIRSLQSKGYVNRSSKARSLTLLRESKPKNISFTLGIPILGRINAGCPLLAEEHIETTVKYDPSLLPRGTTASDIFGLRVHGDSMKDAGILHDDIVFVQKNNLPSQGKIVVALVKDTDTTVKTMYINGDKIELRPANPDFESQFYDFDDVACQGVVVALHRTF